jgi:hypothetical protein
MVIQGLERRQTRVTLAELRRNANTLEDELASRSPVLDAPIVLVLIVANDAQSRCPKQVTPRGR